MASTHKSLRSSTADKRPTTSIADGQIALNTNAASPGLFFKDSAGTNIIKVGPVHVGTTAPNATPAVGGSSGNSTGEVWLDTSLTPLGVKIWDGSSWQNATPAGSTTVQGLLELATNAETQTGTDTARAVTPAGLQSKVSDSTSTTSSTTIASSTAVKSAYDLANAALPKTGGVITGALEIGTTGSLSFEGATANDYETTVAVVDPTADRTVTIPDQNGNFLISGNASIVNADVNASAAIAGTKISPNFGSQTVQTTGVVSHALGTAGAPTITFTGDTNTGVYSPGSDQVAISTGGTGRLFIDSSGRLGVGTSAPEGLFQVTTGGQYENLLFNSNAANTSILRFGGASDGEGPYLFQSAATSEFRIANDLPSGVITFGTGSSSTERARIDSSGRLGLGTSSPAESLHLGGSSAQNIRINGNTNTLYLGTVGDTTQIAVNRRPTDGTIPNSARGTAFINVNGLSTGGSIELATSTAANTGATTAVTINSSGNVGIGTTNPGAPLQVNGAIASVTANGTAARIDFDQNAAGAYSIQIPASTNALAFRDLVANSERLRIDSSGRLLAGTSSSSLATTAVFQGRPGDANGAGTLYLQGNYAGATDALYGELAFNNLGYSGTLASIGAYGGARTSGSPGYLKFSTTADGSSSPTERMRISANGKVSSNNWSLDGQGTGSAATTYIGMYAPGGNALAFTTLGSERARIDSSGNVGIGSSAPSTILHIKKDTSNGSVGVYPEIRLDNDDPNGRSELSFYDGTTKKYGIFCYNGDGDLRFTRSSGETARFDSSGRLLVGTSTALGGSTNNGFYSLIQIRGNSAGANLEGRLSLATNKASNTVVAGSDLGAIWFQDGNGGDYACIQGIGDGTAGTNDYPGRLVFSTTADGSSTPTERMRINSAGFLRASNTGSYVDSNGAFHEFVSNQSSLTSCLITNSNGSFGDSVAILRTSRGQSSAFSLLKAVTTSSLDTEFNLRGDGNAYADGSWNGGGADYAEYFEWSDGNTAAEDRRGISVVLDGDKIRAAVTGEQPIGVISGNPSVVGDADIDRWKGKYLRDDFGTYIQEDYEVEDEDGNTVTQQRRKLNPDYNPDQEYISREDRPEWDCVGLMGKLRIRKGQVTGSRWIKMRDISDSVEEWLVR